MIEVLVRENCLTRETFCVHCFIGSVTDILNGALTLRTDGRL